MSVHPPGKCWELWGAEKKLDNMWLFDIAAYPTTLERAYELYDNFQSAQTHKQHRAKALEQDGVSFVQPGNKDIGPCNSCGQMGHFVRKCPKLKDEERKAILEAMPAVTFKCGHAHASVGYEAGDTADAAKKELQECL